MLIKSIAPCEFPAAPQDRDYYFVDIENGDTFWAAVKKEADRKVICLLSATYNDDKDKAGILPFPCEAYDLSSSLEDDLHDFYKKNVETKEYSEEDYEDAFSGYYSEYDY